MRYLQLPLVLCLLCAALLSTGCGERPPPGDGPAPAGSGAAGDSPWFTDISDEAGLDFLHEAAADEKLRLPAVMGGGVAFFDFDNDGDLDIVSRSLDGGNSVFINGNQNPNALQFEFRDMAANRFGIGSRVTIFYGADGERHQVRELKSGGGFASFDEPVVHFGLGAYDRVSRVVVRWPDGEASEIGQELEAVSGRSEDEFAIEGWP